MKTTFFTHTNFAATFVAVCLFLGGCKDSALEETEALSAISVQDATASQTAQSIMVDMNVNAPVIEGEDVWTFDQGVGATYFTGGTEQQRRSVAQNQRCTFYNGGTLTSETLGGGKNAVTITPNTNPVPAKTGWTLSSSAPSSVPVTLDIVIAGQSVVVNKTKSKYSFTLTNSDGTSRIQNLKVEVTGQADQFPAHTILTNDENGTCLAGTLYVGNAGNFGNATSYLKTNMTLGDIIALNQYGSTAVCGNAAIAQADQLVYQLGEGSYSIIVSGTVKGNGADLLPQSFSVTKTVTVSAQGCQ